MNSYQIYDEIIVKGADAVNVKEKWRRFMEEYREYITFKGKPLATVSLHSLPRHIKYIRLDVR